ncbi:hypothetical protein [Candidatus Magnetaquiglobus chichijimensis]|uniref:hypothetical protein n=1 Tax=Candidatus Magnetaquiglobus chichijimensis TaxID=3141448 RepID=UPI003B97482C
MDFYSHKRNRYGVPRFTDLNLFVTRWSDCEGYFVQPDHVARIANIDGKAIDGKAVVENTARKIHNSLVAKFNNVRNSLGTKKWARNKNSNSQFSPTTHKLSSSIPLPSEQIHGKELLGELNKTYPGLVAVSDNLDVSDLTHFLNNLLLHK